MPKAVSLGVRLGVNLGKQLGRYLNDPSLSRALCALTNFSAANYFATAVGGGEAGVASGWGWCGVVVSRQPKLASERTIARKYNGAAGWYVDLRATSGNIDAGMLQDDGAARAGSYTLNASDAGRILLIMLRHTGSVVELWLGRDLVSTSAAITGLRPGGVSQTLAVAQAAAQPFTDGLVLAELTFRGVPSAAQMRAFADAARSLGDLPRAIDGATVTHRHSLKDQLAKAGGVIIDGQAAPAQLDDTVTGATVDALVKQGPADATGVKVRTIDPSIDGRVTKGVLGFSAAAFLESATYTAVASTFVESWYGRLDLAPSTFGTLVGQRDASPNRGHDLGADGTNLYFECTDGGGTLRVASTPVAPHVGAVPRLIEGVHTGSVIRVLVDGVQYGADVACVGYTPATSKRRVGLLGTGTFPLDRSSWMGDAFTPGAPTLVQLQDRAAATAKAGRIQAITGLTTTLHDPTQDIAANNGELPTQFPDRIGTDHLARLDIDTPKVGPNGVRGVGPYNTSDLWRTADGGGLQVANTEHMIVDVEFDKIPDATRGFVNAINAAATQGHYFRAAANRMQFILAGVGTAAPDITIVAGDVGVRTRMLINKTSTVLQAWKNGVQQGADVAATSVTAPSTPVPMVVGNSGDGTAPFAFGRIELIQGGAAALSPAEITAAFADLTQPPPLTAGAERWRFHDDTAATPTKTPRTSVERVNGASLDTLTRYGAGLQVAQRVERLWSYETSPIMRSGASSSAGANRWQGALSTETGGSASGFYVGLLARPRGTTTGRMACHSGGGPQGWNIVGVAGSQWQFNAVDATGTNKTAPVIFPSVDSKVRAALWTLDAPSGLLRSYHHRAQVGTGTTMSSYNVSGLDGYGLSLGALYGGGSPQPDWDVIGLVYGLGVPTLAQFQAWEDACMALEDIASLEGATHMYSFRRGLSGSTLLDLIGSYHIAPVGAPTITDIYARAWSR